MMSKALYMHTDRFLYYLKEIKMKAIIATIVSAFALSAFAAEPAKAPASPAPAASAPAKAEVKKDEKKPVKSTAPVVKDEKATVPAKPASK